jgi:two-component system, OmpR family, response regulator VicR
MKILIAEDDELILKTLEYRMKKDGYDIIMARDGREALEKIDQHIPDLVISDIMMPYASGLEIITAIREKYQSRIKVILLTVLGQEDVVLEAFKLGTDDFIAKPFSPNELSVRVRRFALML